MNERRIKTNELLAGNGIRLGGFPAVKKEETQGEALLSALKKYKGVDIALEKPYPDGHRYVFHVDGACVDLNLHINETPDKLFMGSIYNKRENELINFEVPLTPLCMEANLDNIVGLAKLPIEGLQSLGDKSGVIKMRSCKIGEILRQYAERIKTEREITESLLPFPFSSLEPTML